MNNINEIEKITECNFFGEGVYNKTSTQMRFLCKCRQHYSKEFDWSLSDAETAIVNEMLELSKSCVVVANGQSQVSGFNKFEKEFNNLFEEIYCYQCNKNKNKLHRFADFLFGDENSKIYSGLMKQSNASINPQAYGFSPFWTFVFMDSDECKLDIEWDDILSDDQRLLSQANVIALLHIDRVALKIGLCIKGGKQNDRAFTVVSKLFFLSSGSIRNTFQASMFWNENDSIFSDIR